MKIYERDKKKKKEAEDKRKRLRMGTTSLVIAVFGLNHKTTSIRTMFWITPFAPRRAF